MLIDEKEEKNTPSAAARSNTRRLAIATRVYNMKTSTILIFISYMRIKHNIARTYIKLFIIILTETRLNFTYCILIYVLKTNIFLLY